jgi:hypothetical protein
MKYMTPELLARAQDENTVDAASEEWDKALDAYTKHLKSVWKKLPRPVRHLAKRANLHDAEVFFVGTKRGGFSALVLLELDKPGDRIFILQYDLIKAMEWSEHSSVSKLGRAGNRPLWLYDEFDMVQEESGFRYYTHSILFSDGHELKLSFRKVFGGHVSQLINLVRDASCNELQPA